jgi:hypothetical protein
VLDVYDRIFQITWPGGRGVEGGGALISKSGAATRQLEGLDTGIFS